MVTNTLVLSENGEFSYLGGAGQLGAVGLAAMVIVARFSRSAEAWRDMVRLRSSGSSMSCNWIDSMLMPH